MGRSSGNGTVVFLVILGIGILVATIVAWCKIFRKAGIHPGKFFIPFYGGYLAYDIAGCGGLFIATAVLSVISSFISSLISNASLSNYNYYSYSYSASALSGIAIVYIIVGIIDLIIHIVFCCKLASSFGKSGGFAVGLIFLYPIFIMILGFGDAKYEYIAKNNGITAVETWECEDCGTVNSASRITCSNCGKQK